MTPGESQIKLLWSRRTDSCFGCTSEVISGCARASSPRIAMCTFHSSGAWSLLSLWRGRRCFTWRLYRKIRFSIKRRRRPVSGEARFKDPVALTVRKSPPRRQGGATKGQFSPWAERLHPRTAADIHRVFRSATARSLPPTPLPLTEASIKCSAGLTANVSGKFPLADDRSSPAPP
jgi:hypothetical protein